MVLLEGSLLYSQFYKIISVVENEDGRSDTDVDDLDECGTSDADVDDLDDGVDDLVGIRSHLKAD